jgi:hypothetical protein
MPRFVSRVIVEMLVDRERRHVDEIAALPFEFLGLARPFPFERLIVISNRIVKEMGFDWFDQIENAPGF